MVSRYGDEALLDEREGWVRTVIAKALEEEYASRGSSDRLRFNRPAQGLCALIHLWRRRHPVDPHEDRAVPDKREREDPS